MTDIELFIKELTLAGYDTGLTRVEGREVGEVTLTHPTGGEMGAEIICEGGRYYTGVWMRTAHFSPHPQPNFECAAERVSQLLRGLGEDGWS